MKTLRHLTAGLHNACMVKMLQVCVPTTGGPIVRAVSLACVPRADENIILLFISLNLCV